MTQFTAQQLADFHAYERVRRSNKFNMMDPRAQEATGLSRDGFRFVLSNFSQLKQAAEVALKGIQ